MENKISKLMDNVRQINQALVGFEVVSYWIYVIIAIIVLIKALLSL
jgi:hypothetical protein